MYTALRITPFPQSPMIEVAFKHRDKNKAAAVVNTLVDTYLEYHPGIYESPDVARFFEKRSQRIDPSARMMRYSAARTALPSI